MTSRPLHFRRWLLVPLALLLTALPASARITRTRTSASSAVDRLRTPSILDPLYSLVVGSGVEYEEISEQTEYGFPILIEYSFTERLKLTIEPKYTSIHAKTPDGRSISGWGDLETTLDFEFLRERRYRPALSVEGKVRWPTAEDPDLGERGRDYTLGLIASKDFVFLELDANVLYTFLADREREDLIEASLAVAWHLNGYVDLIAEVVHVMRAGGRGAAVDEDRDETEATVGFAWIVSKFLRLEQGVVFKEHGVWETVFAWEWSFGGD
jgi:hypothetical protein